MNTKNKSNSYTSKTILEITIVITIMLCAKWLADQFHINGAGSIGIWAGLITASIFMRSNNKKWHELGLKRPKELKQWAFFIVLTLLTIVIVFISMGLVLDPILTSFGLEKPVSSTERFMFFLGQPLIFLSYLVVVVLIGAALGEELLMRGYLFNRLNDLFGYTKLGISLALITQAIFFGILHSYQGLYGIIVTGCIALIFTSIYLISNRNLTPVILAHMIINSITITAFYLNDGVVN